MGEAHNLTRAEMKLLYDSSLIQVGLGDGMRSDHFSWRHTCFTLDFVEGNTKLFENGKMYFEKSGVEDIKKTYEVIAKQIDIVSVG